MESERVDLNLDDLEKVSGGKEYELKGYGKVKCKECSNTDLTFLDACRSESVNVLTFRCKYCGTTTEIKTAVE
ncbi:MAG: hypothetical protein IKF90_15145 [Parasporobacterium sp.]|nr:hypothetical protein [Parasporobacterium sp.]